MSIQLYKHNDDAYRAARCMLKATGKAAVVHPTGTGKSFIAFKLCEEEPEKTICWLAPSEYIFKTQVENLRRATGDAAPANIQFFTYAKLMLMDEEELAAIAPDYIILDEFHRCGAEMWGRGVEHLLKLYEGTPILGLSATAVRYLDNQRNMADELFDGNIASEMTLGEAIVRGILQPPQYVQTIFSYKKDLEKYQRRLSGLKSRAVRDQAEEYLEALRRALGKAEGLDRVFEKHMENRRGKYIVFCSNAEHMQEMKEKAGEWFGFLDQAPHMYSVYSDDPETSREFAEFKQDDSDRLKLLFCIDMLNEGIHVDDISGVILFRPTVSPTVYKQQIGRALAAGSRHMPLIFDIVNNIENLYSIGAIEKEMREAVLQYQLTGESEDIVHESFTVIDEVKNCRELFERLNETLTASWDIMYTYAKEFFETHRHLNVPKEYKTEEGYSLGVWILTQRRRRSGSAYGRISPEQVRKLDAIGMRWDKLNDYVWHRYLAAAREYQGQRGNLDVPISYVTEEGLKLGRWIANLRSYRRDPEKFPSLTEDKIRALDQLGMKWQSRFDEQWENGFVAARQYYQAKGNLDVPALYKTPEGLKLGDWLSNQREAYRKGKLRPERKARLDELGMIWTKADPWEFRYAMAEEFYREHGHLRVPSGFMVDRVNLWKWVNDQKQVYRGRRQGKVLSTEQVDRLERIGMKWNSVDH